jgi:hypothetical protein
MFTLPHKLSAAWMRILLIIFISYVFLLPSNENDWVFLASKNATETQNKKNCTMICPIFWANYYIIKYIRHLELTKSVSSHQSSSLPFVIKVMVWHFVSNFHEVVLHSLSLLPWKHCCEDFIDVFSQSHRHILCLSPVFIFWSPHPLATLGIVYV